MSNEYTNRTGKKKGLADPKQKRKKVPYTYDQYINRTEQIYYWAIKKKKKEKRMAAYTNNEDNQIMFFLFLFLR